MVCTYIMFYLIISLQINYTNKIIIFKIAYIKICKSNINGLLKTKQEKYHREFKVLRNNNIMFRINALHYLNIRAQLYSQDQRFLLKSFSKA